MVERAAGEPEPAPSSDVDGSLHRIRPAAHHRDPRGALTAIEFDDLPFAVRRAFTVTGVPVGTRRGGHGHRSGDQALFCTGGRVEVELRHLGRHDTVTLEAGGPGVLVAEGVWSSQRYLAEATTLLVLCSERYDPAIYDHEVPTA